MNKGITIQNEEILCANCNKKLCSVNETEPNFCSNCGNPLSFKSVQYYELCLNDEIKKNIESIKLRLVSGEKISDILADIEKQLK
ncbi:MAG: hypothetical protein WCR30_04270 [Clostridia bacterium]